VWGFLPARRTGWDGSPVWADGAEMALRGALSRRFLLDSSCCYCFSRLNCGRPIKERREMQVEKMVG
jgi:hypothetical protein